MMTEYPSIEEFGGMYENPFDDNPAYIDQNGEPHYVYGGCYDGTSIEDAYMDVYGEPYPG